MVVVLMVALVALVVVVVVLLLLWTVAPYFMANVKREARGIAPEICAHSTHDMQSLAWWSAISLSKVDPENSCEVASRNTHTNGSVSLPDAYGTDTSIWLCNYADWSRAAQNLHL